MRGTTLAFVLLAFSFASFAADTSAWKIESLAWLAGPWKLVRGATVIEEQWTQPGGATMIGMSRTQAKGKTAAFEFLRIEERDGKLVYIAQPQGGPATEFVATSLTPDGVLFENPNHDFPKKIRYRRVSEKCVTASIEDASGKKKVEFPYCRDQ